jgi:hypothetical protein
VWVGFSQQLNLKMWHSEIAEFFLHIKRHIQNFHSKLNQTIIYRYPAEEFELWFYHFKLNYYVKRIFTFLLSFIKNNIFLTVDFFLQRKITNKKLWTGTNIVPKIMVDNNTRILLCSVHLMKTYFFIKSTKFELLRKIKNISAYFYLLTLLVVFITSN